VAVDLMHSIILVVRLLQQVKAMLVVTVNMLLFPMALVAVVAVLVRQVEPMYLVTTLPLVVLDLRHQLLEHLLTTLVAVVQATALALRAQAVLVVVEMEINIVLVLTLVA
jgi:hypothetical protein